MSMVRVCGSGAAGVALHAECQIVAVLPSSTLPATPFSCAVSWLSAVTVQPVEGSGAGTPSAAATSTGCACPGGIPAGAADRRFDTAATATTASIKPVSVMVDQ